MTNIVTKSNVLLEGVYKKLNARGAYLIKLAVPSNPLDEYYEIEIIDDGLPGRLGRLVDDKIEYCHLMQNLCEIVFSKVETQFIITEKIEPGHSMQFILKNGEMNKLISALENYQANC